MQVTTQKSVAAWWTNHLVLTKVGSIVFHQSIELTNLTGCIQRWAYAFAIPHQSTILYVYTVRLQESIIYTKYTKLNDMQESILYTKYTKVNDMVIQ